MPWQQLVWCHPQTDRPEPHGRHRSELDSWLVAVRRGGITSILERLAPGTDIRIALERIIQQNNGALVVMGWGPKVQSICSGGFHLGDATFSPARLAELAKMDGAIILDDDGEVIVRANVHLIPDPALPTMETGSRHRTAERTAQQTGKPVISVSEDRGIATLFLNGTRHELASPTVLAAKVNQALANLERFRHRLDDAEERLSRLEVADLMTFRSVVTVLQRAELVRRIGDSVEDDARALGADASLTLVQLADLVHGVDRTTDLVLRDYVRPLRAGSVERAASALADIPLGDLHDVNSITSALGFEHPETSTRPRGYRLLSHVPRLPASVRESIVRHFKDFQRMLRASADELVQVEGVGPSRAEQLRHYFDRATDPLWDPIED